MAYNNTSHGSLHALFEASFQKLNDAVTSDTSTVSHKAHCDRVEKHLLSGLSIIGAGDKPADAEFIQHNRPPVQAPSDELTQRHILVGGRHEDLYHFLSIPQYEEHLKYLGNTDFHSYLDIFDELNTEQKHLADGGSRQIVVTRAGCVLQWEHCPSWIIIDDPKIDTTRLLDYGIVIFSCNFLKRRYQESLAFEYFCHTRVALGDSAAKMIRRGNVERPNAVLHSNYRSQVNQNIAVVILDESHYCRNDQSLYFDAVKSLKYHHLFMLSGTPMFNCSEDIMRQSRLMPGGGLFTSKEHYKALFYSDEQQQHPTGPPLQLFNRLYQGLMVA
ncbi:uncharacterized protein FMAN_01351 [Fusarium mangiferae]|uniref:SNF2 N-terminal domain-containing protein n=1 Tax=Fusarium mangiferae TaxID=192010 RepID=A0A1L7SEX9_FUSMA|nr:uncharacterized protein FMAN_01351 [Fusarium mangiferae]CVK84230.1 uncharacterized protein FMAN_01351 [Fusarium mangiferae]